MNNLVKGDLTFDAIFQSLIGIDLSHARIHAGKHFLFQDSFTLGSAATRDYLITTSTTYAHMFFIMDGVGITQFELFEATDKTGTTPQTVFNHNRNSANVPATTFHLGTSGGTTDGTRIKVYKGGSTTGGVARASAASREDDELILKINTKYILRITSSSADNLCNVKAIWYE